MTSTTIVVNIHDLATYLSSKLDLNFDEILFGIKSYELAKSALSTPEHSPRHSQVPAAPRKSQPSCYECDKDVKDVLSFSDMMTNVEAFKKDLQEVEKLRDLYPDDHSLKSS